jgi:hypothetical protein
MPGESVGDIRGRNAMTPVFAQKIYDQSIKDAEVYLKSARETFHAAYKEYTAKCRDAELELKSNLDAVKRGGF